MGTTKFEMQFIVQTFQRMVAWMSNTSSESYSNNRRGQPSFQVSHFLTLKH